MKFLLPLLAIAAQVSGLAAPKGFFRFGKNAMPPAEGSPSGFHPPPPMVDKHIENIFEKNRLWIAQKRYQDPEFFDKLGSGHSPTYMWIGCADARVPANEIMGEDAGSVFVVRNVANLVVGTDFNLMAALQFAVNVLKVPHILVCGHYDCGGVRASMQNEDHVPPLENWLRNIRDVYRLHRRELNAIRDPEKRHRRLVELNVIEQCINLFKTGAIQRRRVETFKEGQEYTTPRIHACVFDPATGEMKRLDVDFRRYINELHDIYDLYTVEDEIKDFAPHAPREAAGRGYNQQQYGSNQQQYGSNQPQYGSNQPQYGSNQPQYGSNQPQYGPNQPQNGANQPQYQANQPQNGANQPQYQANQPQYGSGQRRYASNRAQYASNEPLYKSASLGSRQSHIGLNQPPVNTPKWTDDSHMVKVIPDEII